MTDHLQTALAGVRSLTAYVSVALYVLLVAPPGIVLAIAFNWPEVLYWLARGGVRLGLDTVGITYRATGLEHVQRHRAAVYCVNHASNIEPPILFMVLKALHPKLVVLYKAELRKALPVLKRAWDVVGFVPIERGSRERSMQAIESAAAALRGGKSFLIFPEGTRSRTGKLLPFKKGGFIMAIKGGATIVPVAIQGTSAAMRRCGKAARSSGRSSSVCVSVLRSKPGGAHSRNATRSSPSLVPQCRNCSRRDRSMRTTPPSRLAETDTSVR